jgi:hypothetical protein
MKKPTILPEQKAQMLKILLNNNTFLLRALRCSGLIKQFYGDRCLAIIYSNPTKLMKNFETSIKICKKAVGSLFLLVALGATPLCAQMLTSESLGQLIGTNGSLTIGDKTFSDFGFVASGLSTNPDDLMVTLSTAPNGVDFLSFIGATAVNNLAGSDSVIGDLELSYTVTAASPGTIFTIDQSMTPNALVVTGNQIISEETVQNNVGVVVGNSTLSLTPSDLSDPPAEPGDNLVLTGGPYPQLSVVSDTLIAAGPGQLVGLSVLQQSFHQSSTPEPSAWVLLIGGIGALAFIQRRRLATQS